MFRNNIIKALIINAVILILIMLLTDLSYETNDDYAIANRIVAGSPYVEFTDYFLCRGLVAVQGWLSFINVFVLFQIFISFLAFSTITKLALDLDRGIWLQMLFVLIIAVYSFDHYAQIQFTKTSGLLAVAGMLLIADTIVRQRNWFWFLWALVMMYLSTMLRFEMCIFPICFAGLYLLMQMIHGRRRIREEGYLSPGRLVGYALVLVLLGGAAGVHFLSDMENQKTDELKDYIYYSTYRSYVVDYPIYEHFKAHPEEYADIDITRNDFALIDNWYFDYDGAASAENLTKIKKVYDSSKTVDRGSMKQTARKCVRATLKDMRNFTAGGVQVWILLGIALIGLIRLRPRYWWYIVCLGIGAVCFYLMLYGMGRPAYRVIYIVNLAATMFLLHAIERSKYWPGPDKEDHLVICRVGKALGIAGCIVLMLGVAGGIWQVWGQCQDHAASIEKHLRPAALTERIANDPYHMYVFSTREKCNTESYAHPLRVPDQDKNVVTFGGWGTCSPYLMARLEEYDLSNVFGDIIDNKMVYVIEDKRVDSMEEYFNRWYADPASEGSAIRYKPVDEVDGYRIWQVVRGKKAE